MVCHHRRAGKSRPSSCVSVNGDLFLSESLRAVRVSSARTDLCGGIIGLFRSLSGLCGRLPEFNLIPIHIVDPGKVTVGFVHSFGVNLYSLLL